jgi:hypothetical protein
MFSRVIAPSSSNFRILWVQLDADEIPPLKRTRYASGSGTTEGVEYNAVDVLALAQTGSASAFSNPTAVPFVAVPFRHPLQPRISLFAACLGAVEETGWAFTLRVKHLPRRFVKD